MKTDKPVQKVRYDYFIQKKKRVIKAFNKFCLRVEKELTLAYDKDFADKIIPQAKEEFEDLIPRIPYFGGLINPFNELIMVGAYMVAVHKAMKSHGKTAEETVLIFYDLVDHLFARIPKFFVAWTKVCL